MLMRAIAKWFYDLQPYDKARVRIWKYQPDSSWRQSEYAQRSDDLNEGQPDDLNEGQPDDLNEGQPDDLNEGQPDDLNEGQPDSPTDS